MRQLLPDPCELAGPADLERVYAPPGSEHLRLNFVTALDGAIEIDGRSGPLGGPADRVAFTAMRAVTDVVLVGAGTARAENYGPVRLPDDAVERRRTEGRATRPPVAVVTAQGHLDPDSRLFSDGAEVIVLTTDAVVGAGRLAGVAANVVACGAERVEPTLVVAELRRRGLGRILCEGGPRLARDLLGAGLVDELCLTLAPLLGGGGRATITGPGPGAPVALHLSGLIEGDGLLLARYATGPAVDGTGRAGAGSGEAG